MSGYHYSWGHALPIFYFSLLWEPEQKIRQKSGFDVLPISPLKILRKLSLHTQIESNLIALKYNLLTLAVQKRKCHIKGAMKKSCSNVFCF